MSDLDRAIRARLDEFCESDMCAEDGKAALLAVLDLHRPDEELFDLLCADCNGWSGAIARYPCPTVRVIAEKLGVEADGD